MSTPAFPSPDESRDRLKRSGWSLGEVCIIGGDGGRPWAVWGSDGENQIQVVDKKPQEGHRQYYHPGPVGRTLPGRVLRGLLVAVPSTAEAPLIAQPILLALLAAPGVDAMPPARADAVEGIDFASLSLPKAGWLEGKRGRYRVVRDSAVEVGGGCGFFDVDSADEALRTVYLLPGETAGEAMTVEGTLRLRWVPASHGFAGFWHYRLVDTRRCR